MNYYRRYSGDYLRDTSHLSLAEHGAFTLLLDIYYSTEKPLPAEYEGLYRICRAMSESEQAAVRSVADQYFPVSESGRINNRADRELADQRPRIDLARENGRKGGRPKANPEETQPVTQKEPSGFSTETQRVNSPPPTPTVNTKPNSNKPPSRNSAREGGFGSVVEWVNFLDNDHGAGIGMRGRMDKATGSTLKRWIDAGVTAEQVSGCVAEARETSGGPILNLVTYVDAMLGRKQAQGVSGKKATVSDRRAAFYAEFNASTEASNGRVIDITPARTDPAGVDRPDICETE